MYNIVVITWVGRWVSFDVYLIGKHSAKNMIEKSSVKMRTPTTCHRNCLSLRKTIMKKCTYDLIFKLLSIILDLRFQMFRHNPIPILPTYYLQIPFIDNKHFKHSIS